MDAGKGDRKKKGIWEAADVDHPSYSSYCLFPDPPCSKSHLLDIFSLDQPQPQLELPKLEDNPSSEVLTPENRKVHIEVQAQLPAQPKRAPTFSAMNLPDSNAKETAELNLQGQMSYPGNTMPVASGGSGSQYSGAPTTVEQGYNITLMNENGAGGLSEQSSFSSLAPRVDNNNMEELAHLITVQEAYYCAVLDPDQKTPLKLFRQSPHALVNKYAYGVLISDSGERPADAVPLEPHRISGSSQTQHSVGTPNNIHSSSSGPNNRSHDFQLLQQQMRSPVNSTFKLIYIKGQVPAFCADPSGSRFIQQALETATPEEIIMVYEEIMPYVRTLAIDVFANYAVQKLLDNGPQFYKRKVISRLIGNVLTLSLHMYGCRVVQKAFEICDMDQKVEMARELGSKAQKCARDQYANHVIQKCMECVPPQHIQFIYRSFCGRAKVLSLHAQGCRVMQKVLSCCGNPEIYQTLVSEIVDSVTKLSADQYGNYVVQYILEHGGPIERSIIVKRFAGRIMSMSYHKFASNVIEKCLTFGSYEDRQLITKEILTAGGGEQFDHLTDMMVHLYANFVIQTMVVTAEEWQLALLVEVARRNLGTLTRYPQGRQVVSAMERFLGAREKMVGEHRLQRIGSNSSEEVEPIAQEAPVFAIPQQ
ncbi:pumilio homolog 3-like [Phragmites australis]|uniref:pumilio homolog 3-like n=1 Tax=Phragmites australis TaxID=29695 RepID=UPI002D781504|nr:pumilio homolog 3-like [Phragmites australis]